MSVVVSVFHLYVKKIQNGTFTVGPEEHVLTLTQKSTVEWTVSIRQVS